MVRQLKSDPAGKGIRAAIVAGRWNEPIVEKLVEGAIRGLVEHQVLEKNIAVFWVPGAFEIPLMSKKLATSKKYDCLISVGCVLKGETFHFDHIAEAASKGVLQASLETGIPIAFSVILSDDPRKAWERAGDGEMNSGYRGALAALEMANLLKQMKSKKRS